jgi:hypothetical protein
MLMSASSGVDTGSAGSYHRRMVVITSVGDLGRHRGVH